MIIKNVIVYTEDKKFTAGGIVVHDDKIESIYTTENVPDMLGEEVVDGQGAYAIPGLIDLHFTGVWEMTSVITVKRLLKILQNMRLLWVLQQSHRQR